MRVVKKEIIHHKEKIPVYDLVMKPSNPCFSLGAGVISHNTLPSGSPIRAILKVENEDELMIHVDYSTLEVCCVAFMAQDEKMLKALFDGLDMHRYSASLMYDKTMEDVTPDERKSAKALVFGLLYGKSVESTALDITNGDIEKAQQLFDLYFKAFPRVKQWIEEKHKEITVNKNYVLGYFGNKLMIDPNQKGGGALRNAQNAPIQNLGSFIAGTCMYFLSEEFDGSKTYNKPFGFTHDAYDDILKVDDLVYYIHTMYRVLSEDPIKNLGIPLFIDYEVGVDGLNQCSMKIVKEEGNVVSIELDGTRQAIDKILAALSKAKIYDLSNVEYIGTEDVDYSWEDLFTVGKALKYEWGKTITTTKVVADLVYKL